MGVLARRAWASLSERVQISERDKKRIFQRKPWARMGCADIPNLKVLDALFQRVRGTGLEEKDH